MNTPSVIQIIENSVEQERLFRLRGMIDTGGGDPSSILDYLRLVLSSKDWRKIPDQHGGTLTFRGYIKILGWNEVELLRYVEQNKHKHEKPPFRDPAKISQMEELRKEVRNLMPATLSVGAPEGSQNAATDKDKEINVGITNINSPIRSTNDARHVIARLAREVAPETNSDEADRQRKAEVRERVVSGVTSPHRAAVELGWRQEMVQIPKDPAKAVTAILRHFQADRLETLIRALADHAGLDVVPKNRSSNLNP